jgi:hypothetical protein
MLNTVHKKSAYKKHFKNVRQRRRKTTNTAPTTLSAMQAASQSTFLNEQLYSTYAWGE